jgi:adenylate cyclase
MQARQRQWVAVGAAAAAACLLTMLLSRSKPLEFLELKVYDLMVLATPARTPPQVVLLTIDQPSIETYPEPLLFWHRHYSQALRAAARAGAKTIGVDVAFPIPVARWEPGSDEELARTFLEIHPKTPIVCGVAGPYYGRQQDWAVPWNLACSSAGSAAYVNLYSDIDGFIRRVELAAPGGEAKSFALAVAERFSGRAPAAPSRVVRIRHAGPAGTVARVSLAHFLDADQRQDEGQLRRWVDGKAVLLGSDLPTDRHATPYYAFRPGVPANTAGVEIHASALATLLDGNYLVDLPPVLATSWILLLGFSLAAWGILRLQMAFLPILGATLVATLSAAWLLYLAGWVAPTASWLLAWLCAAVFTLIGRARLAERRGRLFRGAVAAFVGERLATDVESSERLRVEGRREELTVLFTDIRGFTTFSETREPEEIFACLNDYWAAVTAAVVRHNGQVNKFVGDGMLAIFPPVADKEPHALRALRAAMEIVAAPGPFETRAGIHSGSAVVGVVGSGDKLEYTVLGDTVNTASRLEALNKELDTKILLSEAVRSQVGNAVALSSIGKVNVRGKSSGEHLYTVLWNS